MGLLCMPDEPPSIPFHPSFNKFRMSGKEWMAIRGGNNQRETALTAAIPLSTQVVVTGGEVGKDFRVRRDFHYGRPPVVFGGQ